jgi:hypothetical protein
MKSFLTFFKKNLFLNLVLCGTLILSNNSIIQAQVSTHEATENLNLSGMVVFFMGLTGIVLGSVASVMTHSPDAEIDLNNNEILVQINKLNQINKPVRLTIGWNDKFGTIKSINKDRVILNEELDTIKTDEISSVMDLKSAAKRGKAYRTKFAIFTILSGIGFSAGALMVSNDSDSKSSKTWGYGLGIGLFAASSLIIAIKTEAENQWKIFEQNKISKSESEGMKLSLGFGLLNLGAVHTAANVVYTNTSPCITAKLSF